MSTAPVKLCARRETPTVKAPSCAPSSLQRLVSAVLIAALAANVPLAAQWTTSGTNTSTTNNVGIGVTDPDTKLNIAGSMNLSGSTQHYYNVADYSNNNNPLTGAMVIKLPKYGSNTMLQIKINGYDYSSGKGAWEVLIGGYNYQTHGWYNYNADFRGTAPFSQVRLGNNGTNDIIVLGNASTGWAHPKITVSEVITGYSNMTGWGSGWSISLSSSEPTIYNAVAMSPRVYTNAEGNVGIGVNNPNYKLEVNGNGLFSSNLQTNGTFYTATGMISSNSGLNPVRFGINDVEKMRIATDGNVGIGTTTPGSKLHVEGNTYISGSIVTNGG